MTYSTAVAMATQSIFTVLIKPFSFTLMNFQKNTPYDVSSTYLFMNRIGGVMVSVGYTIKIQLSVLALSH